MIWAARIAAKMVLSRLPSGYAMWQRLGLFRHGAMDSAPYAHRVVQEHLEKAGKKKDLSGLVCLELGPGDSVGSALIARTLGASRMLLVDSGSYAQKDMSCYRQLAAYLGNQGTPAPDSIDLSGFETFLESTNARYLTRGLQSLRELSSASVDVIWSQAVLEHVRADDFAPTMRELHRVLKADGVCSHRVDLKDHLGGGLNNLRFSREAWESDLFTRSGFYTNRIRFPAMIDAFKDAGFNVDLKSVDRWSSLPTAQSKMAQPFRSMPPEDLLVSGFDVVLTPFRG